MMEAVFFPQLEKLLLLRRQRFEEVRNVLDEIDVVSLRRDPILLGLGGRPSEPVPHP
jgi:hypothetical protein